MISVGAVVERGFVSVNNELWLFIGVDLRAGKFLGVDDPSGKQSCDCLLLENQMDSFYVFFFFPIRSSTARSRPARGSTPRQSQGSSSTPTNPLPTTVPIVTMIGPALLEKLSKSKTREDASLVFLREAAQS